MEQLFYCLMVTKGATMDNNTREVIEVVEKYGNGIGWSVGITQNAVIVTAVIQIILLGLILWRVW